MKRTSLLTLLLLIALHGTVYAHGMSTKAIQEFNKALTDDGFFGVPRYTTALLPVCTATSAKGKIGYDTTTNTIKFCDGSAWAALGGFTGGTVTALTTFGSAVDAGNTIRFNETAGAIVSEGTTADGFELSIVFGEHTSDRTLTLTGVADGVQMAASGNGLSIGPVAIGGSLAVVNSTGFIHMWSGARLGWTSAGTETNTTPGTHDAFWDREAAAIIQQGGDVNGAPVNQTYKAHDGITGTDVKGASLTLSPGRGTGAAVSNPLTLNRVVTAATGTAAQTYSPSYISCPTKILSNTSATAQTIATITTTTTTAGSVTVDYATTACSASTCDADSGIVKVSWNNNAGTVAAAMSAVAVQSDSDATGTLASTPTATVATNVVSIKLSPTWVTIVPATVVGYATFKIHSTGDTVVCN